MTTRKQGEGVVYLAVVPHAGAVSGKFPRAHKRSSAFRNSNRGDAIPADDHLRVLHWHNTYLGIVSRPQLPKPPTVRMDFFERSLKVLTDNTRFMLPRVLSFPNQPRSRLVPARGESGHPPGFGSYRV